MQAWANAYCLIQSGKAKGFAYDLIIFDVAGETAQLLRALDALPQDHDLILAANNSWCAQS